MKKGNLNRRNFMTAGIAGVSLAGLSIRTADAFVPIKIQEPFHGAVLNSRHGEATDAGLKIQVIGKATLRDQVIVNGAPTRRDGERFSAEITLKNHENELIAVSEGGAGRHEHKIKVIWDRQSYPRYRFSIDDNSFFLRDIAQKEYASLFDCFYLNILRELNKKYGARFVLNCYYTTEDGFVLPQFPDRYQSEWKDNADWLKLAFHAYADLPDRPYQYASAAKLMADWDQVEEQILRFAGEETYSPPTVIHWGMVQPHVFKSLYNRGVRVLSGFFSRRDYGWDVNYWLDDERSEYLSRHDALMDFESGIVFSKADIVCNNTPVEQVVPTLAAAASDPNQAEIMDIFTHEQYFWPFYHHYIPDHAERLETAIRWVTEHGYKPVFFHEGFLGIV
ncbi:MAG: hypothetical protein C4527_01330 [Candidatus Omnitrophota bacterium]|jgi:hypothetical protein|nr:MAG: hypothetical protein C4527_01330 [Candidatus Omnitrophota bacterium]